MVLSVQRRSAANYNRLRPGDFILSVNDRIVDSSRELKRTLDTEEGSEIWEVQIERQGRIGLLPIRAIPNPT
jgi:S1-C subfamily serine protease